MALPKNKRDLPNALVLWWHRDKLRVQCPYCLRQHGHAPGTHPWTDEYRTSECGDPDVAGEYHLLYPYDPHPEASDYGWELDKVEGTYYTVNKDGRLVDQKDSPWPSERTEVEPLKNVIEPETDSDPWCSDDELSELANQTAKLNMARADDERHQRSPQEIWQDSMRHQSSQRRAYIGSCIRRDLVVLEQLFNNYPEDDFASMCDPEAGGNGIFWSAAEENALPTIEYLKAKGVPTLSTDIYGRTPLMEAALWGRIDTVKYLVKEGVNFDAVDGNGMSAYDLARDISRNREERKARAGRVHRESTDSDERRAIIAAYLKRLTLSSPQPWSPQAPPAEQLGFFKRASNGKLSLFRSVLSLAAPTGQGQKAFASMDRGIKYSIINSMSGYSHANWPNVTNNSKWTQESLKLGKYLGHEMTESYASHAEKLLAAYWVEKHVLGWADSTSKNAQETNYARTVGELAEVAPPSLPPRTVIVMSKDGVCRDCRVFFEKLNRELDRVFGVGLRVEPVGDGT